MSEWVSCEERLPVGDDPVLVWSPFVADNLLPYSTSNPEFVRLYWKNWYSHWMPLPEPPKP